MLCSKQKMFFQPPDEEPDCSKTTSKTVKSKSRQKKLRRKNKLKAIRKKQKKKQKVPVLPLPSFPRLSSAPTIPITMSTWAEDYTKAATWQLKNELAYWKSKAKALEYENNILHRTIRQNSIDKDARMKIPNKTRDEFQYKHNLPDLPDSEDEEDFDDEAAAESGASVQDQFEVSEEYIQFLRDNQVYRDFARQERERLKAENDTEQKNIELMEAGPAENTEDHQEELKKLYGDSWERISALEMSLTTQFLTISDQEKPIYWPNVPFNFMY